jgi:DNA repair photolyase
MLYKTGVEYGDYAMNHVLGCSHGCEFPCYAFLRKRRFGLVASYADWLKPYLVRNTFELLDQEIPRLKNKISSVQLCFSTDPFMFDYDEVGDVSLASIKKLNEAGIKCVVLTKGLLPSGLADYSTDNEYGITLVSLNESYRTRIEPGAASYKDRISALKALRDKGLKTWVSVEPYPTPNLIEQELGPLLEAIAFTDKIIFGRANYNKAVREYPGHREFYNEQAKKVASFCAERGLKFHIKEGTISAYGK